jgi:protocatechuate 3,4-dioxygenase beta subunit
MDERPQAPTDPGDELARMQRVHRREALGLLGAGLVALAGCSGSGSTTSSNTSSSTSSTAGSASTGSTATAAASAACEVVPEETAGPFPGDGTNGPDVLTQDGVVRRDIRSNLGSSTPVEGAPLTVDLTVVDVASGCAPFAGAAVYIWHCDAEGRYSMYDQARDDTFLRGVQVADEDGRVQFTSIFPGAYSGRWPHIHFEVFPSLAEATRGSNSMAVSQLAFPEDACDLAYETEGYEQSVSNMARTSLEDDGIFRDGHDLQLAAMSGNATEGFVASLTIGV